MKAYLDLMRKILEEGNRRDDRTGTGTIGLFAAEMRFDLREGFPLVTTKKCHLRSIIHELLWFMSGDTNTKYLTDNGVTIWDEWALPETVRTRCGVKSMRDVVDWLMETGCFKDRSQASTYGCHISVGRGIPGREGLSSAQNAAITINSSAMFNGHYFDPYVYEEHVAGSLGPVYGRLLRAYPTVSANGTVMDYDQLAETVQGIRDRPFSRRHIINLWHPGLLPDESISPQDNVLKGRQALAPCHYSIQFYVQRHSLADAERYLIENTGGSEILTSDSTVDVATAKARGWKEYGLSLKFTMRSTDAALGLPFNIASYACMLMAVANDLGMEPREVIFSGGDVHLYSNHLDGAREQITRTPRPLPKMVLKCPPTTPFDQVKFEDFELTEYVPHPHIKFAISI